MEAVWNWIKARLSEPSTWAGIAAGATAIGVALNSGTTLGGALAAAVVAVIKAEG